MLKAKCYQAATSGEKENRLSELATLISEPERTVHGQAHHLWILMTPEMSWSIYFDRTYSFRSIVLREVVYYTFPLKTRLILFQKLKVSLD